MKGIMKRMAVWVAASVLLTAVPAARAEDGLGHSAVDSGLGASIVDSGPALAGFSTMAASVQTEALTITMENGSAVPAEDYTYTDDILTILGSGSYTVKRLDGSFSGHKIVVKNACTLTLDEVKINGNGVSAPALWVKNDSGVVTIRLKESNRLQGADGYAGLQKEGNGTLRITSANGGTQGELQAYGSEGGAGIGGIGGKITISGGNVTAVGYNGGAGIGGGKGGGGGTVDISGPNTVVTAQSRVFGSNSIVPGCDVGSGANSSDGGSLSVTDGATLIMGQYGTNASPLKYNNCTVTVKGQTIFYPPAPVPAPDNTGGSSGGGGSSRSSGSGSAGTPLLKGRSDLAKVRMIDAAALEKLAAQAEAAGRDYAVLSSAQPVEIQGNAWGALKDFPLAVQMTEAGAVRLQLLLPDPAKLTGPLTLDAAGAEDTAARFGKWFQNPLMAVSVGYEGSLGQSAQGAVWTGWDANGSAPLRVYRYDEKTNAYKEMEDAEPWIDKNGYARFSVPEGGVYVISIGPLKRR